MKNRIRFHLDENVSQAIANGLRRRGIDVTTSPEENLIGKSDQEQLNFAVSQKRVIFTQDTDFLKLHHEGVSHYGIAYCQQKSTSIGEIVQGLMLIWQVLELEEIIDHLEYL
jgi:predicted nuclease of predicted toxin-antitoxin system